MNFLKKHTGKIESTVKLTTSGFPRKVIDDLSKTLKDYGITKSESLIAEFK